jgi:two-component system, NtrC family, nitrogen regulation sensor histidine kinase NtrY
VSLSARFLAYLVLLHALFAGVAFLLLRDRSAWLLAAEAVFAVSLLAGLALLRGLRRGLQPLEEASRLLEESDFTTRFRDVGQPEVDRLIGVYNRMADELREERTRNQEQQGLLARILAVAPSGVVILDFEGRVAFANPAAGRLLGRPEGALAGLRLGEVGTPLAGALAVLPPGEATVVPLAGARRVRCHRGSFLDRGFTRAFLLLEELTEELRQSEKAAYEKLVRMMSHEVGNTVGAGRSLLESCRAYGARLPETERRDFDEALGVVTSRLGQLQEFTRGFADVVRLPPPRLGPCDLGVVARAVATLLRPAAEAEGTSLEVDADPAAGPVAADRTQLEQALVNVGKNALEAAGAGGRVLIRVVSRGGRVALEVEDSGPGIPPEAAAQIFTPFFSTKEQGQGLGLTLVQEILRQHSCEFALEGPPGGPTRFSIVFPAGEPEEGRGR